jgi:hypothetical protein
MSQNLYRERKREKKMNKIALIAGLAVAATASADVLIEIDNSVADQLTITATTGLSAVDASGSNFTGILLDGFLGGASGTPGETIVGTADFGTFNEGSDGTPDFFVSGGSDTGFNIWTFGGASTLTFTAGTQAFVGSVTIDVSSTFFADIVGTTGEIYFPADDSGDIAGAQSLGQYRVVPAPGALALLGLGGIAAGRRRR